jgi:hypothetical protein
MSTRLGSGKIIFGANRPYQRFKGKAEPQWGPEARSEHRVRLGFEHAIQYGGLVLQDKSSGGNRTCPYQGLVLKRHSVRRTIFAERLLGLANSIRPFA